MFIKWVKRMLSPGLWGACVMVKYQPALLTVPNLEPLEDRIVPAVSIPRTLLWIAPANGSTWSFPANWYDITNNMRATAAPKAGDSLIFDPTKKEGNIQGSKVDGVDDLNTTTFANLTIGDRYSGNIQMTRGDLAFTGLVSMGNGDIRNSKPNLAPASLTFAGTSGIATGLFEDLTLVVSGTMNHNLGNLIFRNSILSDTGTVNCAASGGVTMDDSKLADIGTLNWAGSGEFTMNGSSSLYVAQTGAFNISGNNGSFVGNGQTKITVEGTFRKTAGAITSIMYTSFRLGNVNAKFRLSQGALYFTFSTVVQLYGSTCLNGGAEIVFIQFGNGGSRTFDLQGGTLSGAGSIGGDLINAGTVHPGTLGFNGRVGTGGTLTINGTYTQQPKTLFQIPCFA